MKIHALETGTVQVHEAQRAGRGSGLFGFAHTLLSREWTPPLPIHAWVIEHPEGVIVVDTGETARVSEPGYFPWWHPYFRLAVRSQVTPEQEVGPQLKRLGIDPGDVRCVVMTHLHTDHAGGVAHFSRSRILVSEAEIRAARGLPGQLRGYLPQRWPDWFRPERIPFQREPWETFSESVRVTEAGDVRIVPTPGHSAGHVSVVVEEDEQVLLLAGDTSYTEANMLAGVLDGVAAVGGGEQSARQTLERIREVTRRRPVVYLPSHDPEAAARLEARQPAGNAQPSLAARSSPA